MPFIPLVPEERAPYRPASVIGDSGSGSQASKTNADTNTPSITSSSGSGVSGCKFLKLTPEPKKAAIHVQRATTVDDGDKAVESTAKQ
ncbi:hypothetical protein ABEF95_002865 [Exophiala dermatitidis]